VLITRLQRWVALHGVGNRNVPGRQNSNSKIYEDYINILIQNTKTYYTTVTTRICREEETFKCFITLRHPSSSHVQRK